MRESLQDVERGETFRIDAVDDDEVRAKLQRMGFLDGEVTCRQHLAAGPVVISRRGTDLALGSPIAGEVHVAVTDR